VTSWLTQHVEPAVTVEHEVLENNRPDGQFNLLLLDKVIDLGVHHCKAVTLCLIAILHGDEDVASRTENSEELMKRRWVDLTRSKAIGTDNGIIAVVIDWNGAEIVYSCMDVVLVDVLLSSLAQHAKGGVNTIDDSVAVGSNLPTQQTGASCQIQDRHIVVQTKLEEGFSALDVAIVVTNDNHVITILLTPGIVKLNISGGIHAVYQGVSNLLLKFHRSWSVKIVREPANQALHQVKLSFAVTSVIVKVLMLYNLAFAGLHKPSQILLKETKFCQVLLLGSFHGPDHVAIRLQNSQNFSNVIWRHCIGGEATSSDDNIIALLPNPGGSNPADLSPDVVPVKALSLQFSQCWHIFIQGVNIDKSS